MFSNKMSVDLVASNPVAANALCVQVSGRCSHEENEEGSREYLL